MPSAAASVMPPLPAAPQVAQRSAPRPSHDSGAAAPLSPPGRRWGVVASVVGVCALVAAAAGYVAASPYLVLRDVKSAFERQALSELLEVVDRAALKQQLIAGTEQALRRTLADEAELGIRSSFMLQALAQNAAKGLGEGLDKLFSPEGVRELEATLKQGQAMDALFGASGGGEQDQELATLKQEISVDYGYTGLNSFEVRIAHPEVGVLTLTLVRDGLVSWKLAAIDASDVVPALLRKAGVAAKEEQLADAALRQRKLGSAERWLAVLARRGDVDAQYKLAALQLAGVDGRSDVQQGLRNATLAAEQGHLRAAHLLARVYQDGFGVPQDLAQAARWMEQVHRIEPLDRWAASAAGLHARRGDHLAALTWMERALADPPHLTRAERTARNQDQILINRQALYTQYVEWLRRMQDSTDADRATPVWLRPLMAHALIPGEGWGPLRFGMAHHEVTELLGFPTHFAQGQGSTVLFIYDSFVPHGVNATLQFGAAGGLAQLTLSVLPQALVSNLPHVGRTDPRLTQQSRGEDSGGTVLALGCPIDRPAILEYLKTDLDLFPTPAIRLRAADGVMLRVCSNGFVAGAELR